MKCLSIILFFVTLVSTFAAEVNVYKKDFDSTGKAFYFTPSDEFKDKKIAVGEHCTKVVVYIQDANGVQQLPSETNKLSQFNGKYVAEKIIYPGGNCALPDTQKYGKEIITSTPDDLINYYNGKQGPLKKYEFKTEDKATKSAGLSFFSEHKWIIIGVGAGGLLLIAIIVGVVIMYKRRGDDDDYNRYSSSDKDMKKISEPYIGLSNNDPKDTFSIGQPFNTSISNPTTNYSSNWNNQTSPLKGAGAGSNDFLSVQEEPKRITSLTYEEQQSYSDLMKKQMNEDRSPSAIKASPSFNKRSVPEEYEKFKTFKIVRKFTPQRNDELVVENGHLVKLIKSFEDGWTLCYNINTKKEGYIPKNKLGSLDQPPPPKPQSLFHSDTTSTTSSAYSTKPLLHSNSGASSNYSNYNSNGRRPQRPINTRSNSNASRTNGSFRGGSPKSPGNKYYRRPSNDNYGNSGYRSQNRYDM